MTENRNIESVRRKTGMNAKALLVVDVQEEYMKRYEEGLLKRINQRIGKAVEDRELIVYIENIKMLSLAEKKSPFATGLYIASPHVFSKKKASAFSNEELVNFLKEKGITILEIIGVDGNYCVLGTAKEGKKYLNSVSVNCNCVGAMNNQRYEKTKETLSKLGVEILN